MKQLFVYLRKLSRNLLFRETLLHFSIFFAAIAGFYYLTAADIITRAPERVVPAEYAVLATPTKVMPAVDLERLLRKNSNEVEGLVFFDGIKTVVVQGAGFETDRIVLQADIDQMRKLATSAKVPVIEKASQFSDNKAERLPSWWWWTVAAFFAWFSWLMFFRRHNKEEHSRLRVILEGTPPVFEALVKMSRLPKRKFFLVLLFALVGINSLGFFGRLYHDNNMYVLPPEMASIKTIQPWQIDRHLDRHSSEFLRVTGIKELSAAYVVLDTVTPQTAPKHGDEEDSILPSGPSPASKTFSVERTVVFPATPAGKAAYDAFIAKVQAKKIEYKQVPPSRETGYFESITSAGRVTFLVLLVLSIGVGVTLISCWSDWKEGETPQGRTNLVGAGGGGGGNAQVEIRDEDRKTFADVAGCQEAIDELRVVEKKIRRPRIYKVFGAPVPSGVILFGPPGTGKTLLARALAGEIGGHFEACSGSQFVEMYVGVGAKRVREMYAKARAAARKSGRISIVFIDEIDAIAKKRGSGEGGGDKEYEQTLNELLVQMNGFGNHGLVLTMAATNRLDILDDAILRPGRFDIKVKVPKPDKKGRSQIYGVYLKKLKIVLPDGTVEEKAAAYAKLLDDMARRSHDFSGAEIEGAIKNGATIAVERQFGNVTEDITEEQMEEYKNMAIITVDDLNEGVDKMAYGTQIKSRVRTDKERWATAVHEIGHAAIPTIRGGDPVNRITIVMTEKSLGLMDSSPEEGERYDWTDQQFLIRLETMLAGRGAEKLVLNKISTGASNDFERTSQLARQMVGVYGMSKTFGVKSLPLDQHGFPVSKVGEILLDKFNLAWGEIVDNAETSCDELLAKHRKQIEACAQVLYEEETLTGDEFRRIWKEAGEASEPAVEPKSE
ncbi:MAG: AAA family ATPase [Candidatus Obscuribacter sp.]|nr:AAA family ATPase [Candidatus Obscuribacter sp.]